MGNTPIQYDRYALQFMQGNWPRTEEEWNSGVERALSEVLEKFTRDQIESIKDDLGYRKQLIVPNINIPQTYENFLFLRAHGCGVWQPQDVMWQAIQARAGVYVFGTGGRSSEDDRRALQWVIDHHRYPACRWALGYEVARGITLRGQETRKRNNRSV